MKFIALEVREKKRISLPPLNLVLAIHLDIRREPARIEHIKRQTLDQSQNVFLENKILLTMTNLIEIHISFNLKFTWHGPCILLN